MGSRVSLSSEAEEERETQREKMCVRFTLIIANCLLALLGLLLLAGGVWRIVDGLEEAVKEAASHKYFNYALLAMGGVTLLVALFGFCGAKKESQCLLSLYSICVFIILLLQIAAIVFINVDDANISFIKE